MGVNTRNKIVTNGLVLHLDAGNPMSYQSGSTTWRDLSGNGNNATIIANRFDMIDKSIIISGSSASQPTLTNNITLSPLINWSFEIIFRSNQQNTSSAYFYPIGNQSNTSMWMYLEFNTRMLCGSGIGLFNASFSPGLPLNRTYNVMTFVCTQGTGSLFINGNNTTYTGTQTGDIIFNTLGTGRTVVINGSISTFKLYNRSLTLQEITQNYNASKSRFNLL